MHSVGRSRLVACRRFIRVSFLLHRLAVCCFFLSSSLFLILGMFYYSVFGSECFEGNDRPSWDSKRQATGGGQRRFLCQFSDWDFFMSCSLSFGWHEMSTFVFVYMVEFFLFSLFFCLLSSFLVISTFAKSKKHGKTGLRKPGMLFSTLHLLLRYSLFLASHACLVSLPCAFRLCSIT